MRAWSWKPVTGWVALFVLAPTAIVSAADYSETVHGDLSGNRLAPTHWNVSAGVNRLLATTSPGDQEYFRVNIPDGHRLGSLVVQIYTTNDTMFIGVQQGATFSVTPSSATAGDMYGYVHFGTSGGNVGADILDDMGSAPGAIGFVPPIASGNYTFWLQQGTTGVTTTYQLNFAVLRPGDYDGNGAVDAANYVAWRNTVGSMIDFRADGTGPAGVPDHVVNDLDYQFWRTRFGQGSASAANGSEQELVPEPVANALMCLAAFSVWALTPRC